MTTAIQAPKRPRGPRKPVLNAAMIPRAQELMAEHRAAEQDLARLVAETAGRIRLQVQLLPGGATYTVLAAGLATLLAKDLAAIEAEAERLGVVLKEPEPAPLLNAIKDAGGAVPDDPAPPALLAQDAA